MAKAIKFLFSPAGRVGVLFVAFFAWGAYQRYDATQDCIEEQLMVELQKRDEQNAAANQIAQEARERADEAENELERLRRLADEILAEGDQDDSCTIPDDVRERLLEIQ